MPTTPLSNNQQQPGHNRAKSWLLISLVLFAVMVMATAFVVFRKKIQQRDDSAKMENAAMMTEEKKDDGNVGSTSDKVTLKVLAGTVSEIISAQDESGQKWITLSVSLPKNIPSTPPGSEQKTAKTQSAVVANTDTSTNTLQYKFFLAKDTVGVGDISGGEFVAISFVRDPSTEEYVDAEKIEILDNHTSDSNPN